MPETLPQQLERLRRLVGLWWSKPWKQTKEESEAIQAALAIIDKLPKAKNGQPVVPGMDIVWHPSARDAYGEFIPLAVDVGGVTFASQASQRQLVNECYSTREAVETAMRGGDT